MRIGVGLLTMQHGARGRAAAHEIGLARDAERLGFDDIWLSEHHFTGDGHLPSVLPLMGSILAATSRIGVGSGVALLPLHDVERVRAGVRVLAKTGRSVAYGVGLGYRDIEFAGLGVDLTQRGTLMEGSLGRLLASWPDGTITLWVGAIVARAVERAARLRLPVLFPTGSTLDEMSRRIERYREVAGVPGTFGAIRDVVLAPDVISAGTRYDTWVHPVYEEYLGLTPISTTSGVKVGAAVPTEERDAVMVRMRQAAIVGTGADLQAALAALGAIGLDTVVLRCLFPLQSADDAQMALAEVAGALPERTTP